MCLYQLPKKLGCFHETEQVNVNPKMTQRQSGGVSLQDLADDLRVFWRNLFRRLKARSAAKLVSSVSQISPAGKIAV